MKALDRSMLRTLRRDEMLREAAKADKVSELPIQSSVEKRETRAGGADRRPGAVYSLAMDGVMFARGAPDGRDHSLTATSGSAIEIKKELSDANAMSTIPPEM